VYSNGKCIAPPPPPTTTPTTTTTSPGTNTSNTGTTTTDTNNPPPSTNTANSNTNPTTNSNNATNNVNADNTSNNKCQSLSMFLYNGDCVSQCPDATIVDSVYNICYSCTTGGQYLLNTTCVLQCPQGYYAVSNKCTPCSTTDQYSINDACFTGCPPGTRYDPDLKTCNTLSFVINGKINLNLDPTCVGFYCLNGGTCDIKFDKPECVCLDQYIGDQCQFEKASLNVEDYFSKILLNYLDTLLKNTTIPFTMNDFNNFDDIYSFIKTGDVAIPDNMVNDIYDKICKCKTKFSKRTQL
jgi:hypothetical protein